jgi:hypothetical protein
MATGNSSFAQLRKTHVLLVLALLVVFTVGTAYAVMSDISVRGLTIKIFNVSRYCTVNPTTQAQTVTFYIVAGVWSASSLRTSISQVTFSLSASGVFLAVLGGTDGSWNPGQGTTYQLTFLTPSLNPLSLPSASSLVLALTANVKAGILASAVTTSDTLVQNFVNTSC